jgi:hypothetical protein
VSLTRDSANPKLAAEPVTPRDMLSAKSASSAASVHLTEATKPVGRNGAGHDAPPFGERQRDRAEDD